MMIMSAMTISISILLAVAFFTLLERKFLSYSQNRKGPNKVSIMGLMQPMADAAKLLTKSQQTMENMNPMMNYSFPSMALLISLLLFPMIPLHHTPIVDTQFNMIIFLVVSSMAVYVMMGIGWSSNSKYSHLGSIRNIAQMISYEISFFLIILNIILISHSFNLTMTMTHQMFMWFMFGMSPLLLMWLISCSAEVNRTPFDFAEGESELVSGFNVEYTGGQFALVFLAEYASIILLSYITYMIFSPHILMIPIVATIFLWMRATLPRFRYDMLMNMNWKMFLPTTLLILTLLFMYSNI